MDDLDQYCADVLGRINSSALLKEWPDCYGGLLKDKDVPLARWIANLTIHACVASGGEPMNALPITTACLALSEAAHLLDQAQDTDIVARSTVENITCALIFAAYDFLSDVQPGYANQVMRVFSISGFNSAFGQNKGLALTRETPPTEALAHYWNATILKSGNLLRMATAGSAAAVTHDQKLINALANYGIALGVILQILDDCRDILDEQGVYEISLPVILYSLAIESPTLTLPQNQSRKALLNVLKETGTLQVMSDVLLMWQQKGVDSLAVFDASDAAEQLKAILADTLHQGMIQVAV